jgi:predicted AlkP superfamily phosphohydrolase/phosphomutase
MSTELSGKAVVLGLDGATWDLLRPLAERGVMPNLAGAMEQGRHGPLQSCLPPFSSPAWVSIATGKNPGSHGIFDFWEAGAPGDKRLVSSRSARGKKLWELASDAGKVVHVVAVPVSYPPSQVNGSFVCGMFTPGESVAYTWPPELKAELKALPGGYEADPYARGLAGRAFLEQTHAVIRNQEVATRHLLDKGDWDLLFTVIQAPDPLQHKFWNVLDPADPRYDAAGAREYLPLLEETYRRCDEVIGDRMAMAERGATVLVISDHGFGRYEKLFNLNRVLEDAGLLHRHGRSPGQVAPRGLSTRQVIQALRRLDVLGLERRLPGQLKQRLAGRIDSALSAPIDTERTLAFAAASSAESVFIAPHVPDAQRADVARQVIEAIEAARDPDTGEPIVERAYRREDLYEGSELRRIPDILLDFGERPYLASDRLAATSIVEPIPATAGGGRHRRYGILLALGPGVNQGSIEGARIVDVAPTALHAMGLPVPDDMDGRVLTELFADGRAVERSSATDSGTGEVIYTEEEAAAIEKSLENLGYI